RFTSIPRARSAADRQPGRQRGPPAPGRPAPLRRGEFGGVDALVRITLDQLDVLALDTDQSGRAGAARRVQVALVINVSIARRELVIAQREGLAGLLRACRRHPLIVGHDRLADGLAIDRPGRAVIMWLALFRAVI